MDCYTKTPKLLCTIPNNHKTTRTSGVRSKISRYQSEQEVRGMWIIESHYGSLLGQAPSSPSNTAPFSEQKYHKELETKKDLMIAINLESLQQGKEKRIEYRRNMERKRSELNENPHLMSTLLPTQITIPNLMIQNLNLKERGRITQRLCKPSLLEKMWQE